MFTLTSFADNWITLCLNWFRYVLVIPWFVRMYDAIMHERERVHYRTYMRRTMV